MATVTSRPPGLRGYDARWSDATGTALVGPDGGAYHLPTSGGPHMAAALGDSITAAGYVVSANFGLYSSYGWTTWASVLLHQRIWVPLVQRIGDSTALVNYNRAVAGETPAQVLARVPEVLALSPRPRFCFVMTGTNDLTVNQSYTSEQTFNGIVAVCDALLAGGVTPILSTLLPRGNGTAAGWSGVAVGDIPAQRQKLFDVNRKLRVYARTDPRVHLVDPWSKLVDPASTTNDPIAALFSDYLHPYPAGAHLIGEAVFDVMDPLLGPVSEHYSGAGDAWHTTTNPKGALIHSSWATTGGTAGAGITGDVPAGWTANRFLGATSTAVTTLRTRADGKNGYEMLFDIAGTDTASFRIYGTAAFLAAASFVTGEGVFCECDVEFTPVAGTAASSDLQLRPSVGGVPDSYALFNDGVTGLRKAFSGRLRTPILVSAGTGVEGLLSWTVEKVANGSDIDVVRRGYQAFKYDTTAAGALSW